MIKEYFKEAVTDPLVSVSKEMLALGALAAVGVLVGAATVVMYVGNRLKPKS